MRIGYYILRKGKLLFSQDSKEVLNFFKDLLENDMIEFPVEEKVKPLNYIKLPYTNGLKKEAREKGLTIPKYIQFLLENSKKGWRHEAAVFAKKYFYNNKFQPKLKAPWLFTEKSSLNIYNGIINVMSFEEFLNVDKKHFELQENRLIEKKYL